MKRQRLRQMLQVKATIQLDQYVYYLLDPLRALGRLLTFKQYHMGKYTFSCQHFTSVISCRTYFHVNCQYLPLQPYITKDIQAKQGTSPELQITQRNLDQRKTLVIVLNEDRRTMQFHNLLYAPTNLETRKQNLEDIHDHSKFSTSMKTQNIQKPEAILWV